MLPRITGQGCTANTPMHVSKNPNRAEKIVVKYSSSTVLNDAGEGSHRADVRIISNVRLVTVWRVQRRVVKPVSGPGEAETKQRSH